MFEHTAGMAPYKKIKNFEMNIGEIPQQLSQKVVAWFDAQDQKTKKAIASKLTEDGNKFFSAIHEIPVGIVTAQKEYLALKLFAAMCQEIGASFPPFRHVTSKIEAEDTDVEVNIKLMSSINNIKLSNYLPWGAVAEINNIIKKNASGKNIEQLMAVDSNFSEKIMLSPLRPVYGKFSETAVNFFGSETALMKSLHEAMLSNLDYKLTFGFLKEISKPKNSAKASNNLEIKLQKESPRPEESLYFSRDYAYTVKIPESVLAKIKNQTPNKSQQETALAIIDSIEKNLKEKIESEIESRLASHISEMFEAKLDVKALFSAGEMMLNSDGTASLDFTVTPTIQIELVLADKIMEFLHSVSLSEKELLLEI